jgi:hypothetical protein
MLLPFTVSGLCAILEPLQAVLVPCSSMGNRLHAQETLIAVVIRWVKAFQLFLLGKQNVM